MSKVVAFETYTAIVPDWATVVEYVVHEPDSTTSELGELRLQKSLPSPSFLVAVLATPDGLVPPFLDAEIQLTDPHKNIQVIAIDTVDKFISANKRLIVIRKPGVGTWKVAARCGSIPFAVTVMAFHPAVPSATPTSPGSTAVTFKCRACKTTAKGLALAIVAAVTMPTLPASLVTAVATYLGAGTLVAAAFISSVVSDTADVIAEKLCKRVGLC